MISTKNNIRIVKYVKICRHTFCGKFLEHGHIMDNLA
jgi:hypothetical protein